MKALEHKWQREIFLKIMEKMQVIVNSRVNDVWGKKEKNKKTWFTEKCQTAEDK